MKLTLLSKLTIVFVATLLLPTKIILADERDELLLQEIKKNPKISSNSEDYYIVDGDILVTAEQGLSLLKQRSESLAKLEKQIEDSGDEPSPELAVMLHNDAMSIWPESQKILSFMLDKTNFSEQEIEVLQSVLDEASESWNNACKTCRIKFQQDSDQELKNHDFLIKHVKTNDFYAAAFFPHYPKEQHLVRISPTFFTQTSFNKAGIIRHEFGHVLGYRHEHIRHPSLQDCKYEDGNWKGLTEIDSKSVMHYLCDGKGDPELKLTELDIRGHKSVYSN